MIILTLRCVEEYSVDGQVVEVNTNIPYKWVVRESWQGEDLEIFDTKSEAEQFVKEYEQSRKYNGKGYIVTADDKIVSPVFGNKVSAQKWLERHTLKGARNGSIVAGIKYKILPLDITLGLLELLKLDNDLNQ